ncbi:MAG: hypothetical protein RL380_259 [Verrucomicrobiota bacterium]|jgi:uncharacterized repeat protein (TIGR01451 family)
MTIKTLLPFACAFLLGTVTVRAEHRATFLGHPATRFAPPRTTPESLRELLTSDALRADLKAVLDQADSRADVDDLRRAAATAEIQPVQFPAGSRFTFMSTRHKGKPIALMDVVWVGKMPIEAFQFDFSSKGRRYRCITPKPCSNFLVEDLGAEAALAITCESRGEVLLGKRFEVCLTVKNTGGFPENSVDVSLPIPAGAQAIGATDNGTNVAAAVVWHLGALAPGNGKQVCASFIARQPEALAFTATTVGGSGTSAQTQCDTLGKGVAAILLEVVDLEDPIEVGKEINYELKVTNQGSATGTNVKLICTLPDSQEFVAATGATAATADGHTVTLTALPELAAKASATWHVVTKALTADDARFKTSLTSDQFTNPIEELEATQQY